MGVMTADVGEQWHVRGGEIAPYGMASR